jgi:large subunit ribosomal protein L17
MPATPRRARNFGGSSQHQKLMMANLAASLFAAEGIVTTEAKAKALRPIAEKLITKAKKATDEDPMRIHRIRQIQGYLGDKEMTNKLVADVAPRYLDRNGGYLRILKLGPRQGDKAQMARIELV